MKYFHYILLFVLIVPNVVLAQKSPLKWESKTFDYGTVSNWDNPPAEFTFTNKGSKPALFLPLFYQRDVKVQLPEKSIQPGETATLTVYYYTSNPGLFNRDITLYVNTSGDPITLTVKGNIKSIYANALTACPTFGSSTPTQKAEELTILVIDKETEKPIPTALVEVRRKSRPELREFTNGKGTVKAKLDIGNYVIEARKNEYVPVESEIYVNMRSGVITIPLEKVRPEPVLAAREPEPEPDIEPQPQEQEEPIIFSSNINDQFDEPVLEETEPGPESEPMVEETITEPEPEDDGLLSRKLYNANNVVFLIDVSGSMRRDNKMDMLKTSIKELVAILRDIDKITVITYATSTNEVLNTTNADEKHYINELIDSLTPGGWTNGVLGLQDAYDRVEKNFLDGGNNQIILATDGKFNSSSFSESDMLDMIKDKSNADIKLSVVGFGQSDSAQRMMKRMANKGKGNYMQILPGQTDLGLLVEEIKANSRKVN